MHCLWLCHFPALGTTNDRTSNNTFGRIAYVYNLGDGVYEYLLRMSARESHGVPLNNTICARSNTFSRVKHNWIYRWFELRTCEGFGGRCKVIRPSLVANNMEPVCVNIHTHSVAQASRLVWEEGDLWVALLWLSNHFYSAHSYDSLVLKFTHRLKVPDETNQPYGVGNWLAEIPFSVRHHSVDNLIFYLTEIDIYSGVDSQILFIYRLLFAHTFRHAPILKGKMI